MLLPPAFAETWNGFLDLLYPPKCLVCCTLGVETLCGQCRADFADLVPPVCEKCGLEVSPKGSMLCPKCEAGEAYYFAKARAAGRYDGTLRQAILNLKYGEKRKLVRPLGAYLAAYLGTYPFAPDEIDLIIPVPLHPSRLRQRGFNQAALLAHEVGRALGVPVKETALRRTRRTRPQAELRASERAKNIQNAFTVADAGAVLRKSVVLLDDVITTV